MASPSDELMKVPLWAWWTFGLSLALVVIFLLLDWLLIRRNALSSSSVCFSFRRHPSGKFGYSSASHCSGGAGLSAQDYFGIGPTGGGTAGSGGGGAGLFGHHKRSTNLILSV